MKEYIQPEVELVQFTSESVTSGNFGESTDDAVSNVFTEGDITWG